MADKTLFYPLARKYLAGHFWAIREETLHLIENVLQLRSMGVELDEDSRVRIRAIRELRAGAIAIDGVAVLTEHMTSADVDAAISAARRGGAASAGAVAVIPMYGVIDQKIGSMSDISGGTSVDGFMKQFRQCLNDPGVAAIVLDVDSPGGNVSGVPEAAAEILASRGQKPIVAVANTLMASAAYYLACASDELVCMPSGSVGSIGVFSVHDDYSQQNEMIGYKPTYISFGKYKTEGNPDQPLDPDAQAYIQKQIDSIGADFQRFVAKARNVPVDAVRSDFGQGRVLLAKDAQAAKMIDRIDTLDATIARVARTARSSAAASSTSARAAVSAPAAGVVPPNVSDELAPKDTAWSKPTLSDFTDKAWNELSDTDKRRIAGHYAWAKEMPPASFGDLDLPHHRPSDGKVVFKGVSAAAGRLDQADIPSADKPAVKAHLRHHYEQFKEPIPDSLKASAEELQAAADHDRLDLAVKTRATESAA